MKKNQPQNGKKPVKNDEKESFFAFTPSGKFIRRVVIKNTILKPQGIRFLKGDFLFCNGLDEDEEPNLIKNKIK